MSHMESNTLTLKTPGKISFIIIIIILAAIPLLHITVRHLPYVYNDEFGYWFNAAGFAGLDWSETFSQISYYSYGYGIILALLLTICGTSSAAYTCALLLNGAWLALAFIFLYKTVRLIYAELKPPIAMTAAAAAVLFSSNIAQANYTWPETFLCMLFCALAFLVISIIKKPTWRKLCIVSILSIYSYSVHQRTLGITVSIFIIILCFLFLKKITWKQWLWFIIPFVICIIASTMSKSFVIDNIWLDSTTVAGNNLNGQAGKILSVFSIEGLRDFMLSLLGKLYYIFGATFFIVPFAIYKICTKWIFNKGHKIVVSEKMLLGLFLILAFIMSLLINTIFMIHPDNVTHIVYGRYIDNLLPVFLMIGIIEFFTNKISVAENAILIGLFLLETCAVYYAVNLFDLIYQAAINNIGIAYLVNEGNIQIWLGLLCILAVWIFLQIAKKIFHKNSKSLIVSCCVLIAVFIAIGTRSYYKFEMDWGDASIASTETAYLVEEILDNYKDMKIYAVDDSGGGYPGRYVGNGIQFLLRDQTVHSISLDEASKIEWPTNCIIISYVNSKSFTDELDGFTVVNANSTYKMHVPSNIAPQIESLLSGDE